MTGGGAVNVPALLLLAGGVAGHVSLLWPPARAPGLDFLDTFRTVGECGTDPGETRTVLKAGSTLNVSWHLGYPHGGGYRLELVSPGEGQALQLLPSPATSDWEIEGARFSQSHVITIPQGTECENCYLKLERQATEWGKKYKFRSCSDVRIISGGELDCGEGSRGNGGECVCSRGWEGDRCQYRTDCQSDLDCNGPKGQGKCVITDTAVFRIGQCFCASGWQGVQCEIKSLWEAEDAKKIVKSEYQAEELGPGVSLLWKRLGGGDIEMVMSAPTMSWIGLGWRPSDSTIACQAFPTFLPKPRGTDFHAMDCTDMVIGAARDGMGRVGDYYTRDRSTPRVDKDYGGEEDLVGAHAWEEDGVTTLRMVRSTEGGVADHPLKGSLFVIWGHGQESDFYKPDQLKYHGKTNRGITVIDFGSEDGEDGAEGGGASPIQIGLGISCVLLILMLGLQIAQNLDRKLSCLNPYRTFSD